MKFERVIRDGDIPTTLKIGLFRADSGKVRAKVKFRPLFLAYLFIPKLLKFWLSIEKEVISTMYCGFIKRK